MRDELEMKLNLNFPWFVNKGDMGYGDDQAFSIIYIECGDGWYNVIFDMLSEIQDLYEEKQLPINISFWQIKEKFGEMRIYAGDYIDGVNEIINKYEMLSTRVCEICGSAGTLRYDGWCTTRCDDCKK